MATVFYFNTEDLMRLFHPKRCGNYFNEPNLLQDDIRSFLRESGQLEWADIYSTEDINWVGDFRELLKDFIKNKGLDYKVLERWCSRSDYGAIDKEAFSRRFPPKVESIGIGIQVADVAHWWIKQWDSSEKIELGLVSKTKWPLALSNLFFPFLFYNFHALYAKAIGYKYLGGYCRARKCKNLYLVSTTGSLPKFCDPVCRNRENVNLFREKQRGKIAPVGS
jgi:hypothetical protein